MKYHILIGLLFILACNLSVEQKVVNRETLNADITKLFSGKLTDAQSKFLLSMEYINSNDEVNPEKVDELFKKFKDNNFTYAMLLEEIELKKQFNQSYHQQVLMPIYKGIDSLCLARDTARYYKTPENLYGDCQYLMMSDELFIKREQALARREDSMMLKFEMTETFSRDLNSLFDVHK